jgi:hypothetical protein
MPGAVDRLAHHESLGERAAIVRAGGTDREDLISLSREENRLIAHMPLQHRAIGDLAEIDARREIGARRPSLLRTHVIHPTRKFVVAMQRPSAELSASRGFLKMCSKLHRSSCDSSARS